MIAFRGMRTRKGWVFEAWGCEKIAFWYEICDSNEIFDVNLVVPERTVVTLAPYPTLRESGGMRERERKGEKGGEKRV